MALAPTSKTILIISWFMVLGSILFVGIAFLGAFSAGYHPASNGAAFAPFRMEFALKLVPATLVFALWNSLMCKFLSTKAMKFSLIAFVFVAFSILQYGELTNRQPEFYLRYVGDTPYAFPRVYSGWGASTPGESKALAATYCYTNKRPQYSTSCRKKKGHPKTLSTQLSPNQMTKAFNVYYALDGKNITYFEDTILFVPENENIKQINANGLTGYSFRNRASIFVFLNHNGEIQYFAHCYSVSKYCSITARTDNGNLTFPSTGPAEPDLERWQKDQAWHEALFDEWRCDEPTCDGLLDGSAPQKQ